VATGQWALLKTIQEVLPLLRRWPGAGVLVIYRAWDQFCREVGRDFAQVFTVEDVARFAGVSRNTMDDWILCGIVKPIVQGGAGRGTKSLWSFKDAFLVRLIGCMSRAGMKNKALRRFAQSVQTGQTRSPEPEPEEAVA
jgi:hypothetical protein